MNQAQMHLRLLQQAFRNNETGTPLASALARLQEPVLVGEDGVWLYEGFISLFHALHEAVRAVDPAVPAGLPAHCLETHPITRFFRLEAANFGDSPNPVLSSRTHRVLTVKEASALYFQGKISPREVNALFHRGLIQGFRVGTGRGKILIYQWSLDDYRISQENLPPVVPRKPQPVSPPQQRLTRGAMTGFQFFNLPDKAMPRTEDQG